MRRTGKVRDHAYGPSEPARPEGVHHFKKRFGVRKRLAETHHVTKEQTMRSTFFAAMTLAALGLSGLAHAEGFTPQELDRMSKERLDHGDFRKFAAPPAPSTVYQTVPLHQPQGLWVCMSTDAYAPILSEPRTGSPVIGQSAGEVAAGADRGGYTSVLFHEGVIGWVPKSAVRPYRNEFNPRASCRVGGIRPNGVVTFDVR